MAFAPVGIFIFNRPTHTQAMLEALLKCEAIDESPIFVFGDGPRNAADEKAVAETRSIVKTLLGNRANYVLADQNIGCRESIVKAVTQLCSEFGSAIFIEDDLVVHPYFLTFMNHALDVYENQERVMHVGGYMYPSKALRNREEVLFMPFMIPWGWGTWHRAWQHYDPKAVGWEDLERDAQLRRKFDFDNARNYSGMLKNQIEGQIDAWDILWYWTMFQCGGLGVFPPRTLVMNIGFDGSGTHSNLSAKLGLRRQKLAEKEAAFVYSEPRTPSGPERAVVWRASARLGKRNPVYFLKHILGKA